MDINNIKKLAYLGYSIIPCSKNKTPIGSRKKYQTEH